MPLETLALFPTLADGKGTHLRRRTRQESLLNSAAWRMQQIWELWDDFGTVCKLLFKVRVHARVWVLFYVWIWVSDVIVVIGVFSCYDTILFFTCASVQM